MKLLAKIIGSTFGSGYSPVAPGTAGSLVAIVALWFLPPISTPVLLAAITIFYIIGVWAAGVCEADWGHDPGKVVWDEVVGMMINVLLLPKSWIVYGAAFFIFRLMDIVKPNPANVSQKLPAGWGVMTDDVIAAIYGNIVLQIVFRLLFPSFVS